MLSLAVSEATTGSKLISAVGLVVFVCTAFVESSAPVASVAIRVFLAEQVSAKGPKPREPILAVHVMLDDVKREVVEPAKTPDRDGEQHGGLGTDAR